MTYHLNPQPAKPKPRPPRRPVPPPTVSIPPPVRPMYSDAIQKPLQIHEPVFPDLPSTSALPPFLRTLETVFSRFLIWFGTRFKLRKAVLGLYNLAKKTGLKSLKLTEWYQSLFKTQNDFGIIPFEKFLILI